MTSINSDALYAIAEFSPELDTIERVLAENGLQALSAALVKLEQDVGLQMDRETCGFDETDVPPGPISARLSADFEPVTPERLLVLGVALEKLGDPALKEPLTKLIQGLRKIEGNERSHNLEIVPSGPAI